MKSRWIIEGQWSGYTSSQSHCCYRQIFDEKKAKAIESMHRIMFSDGTCLYLSARPAKFREKIVEQKSYQRLVMDELAKVSAQTPA